MKKIQSLFKRDYDGNRLVVDEVVNGSEWVINGEGVATVKFDGTSCMVRNFKLFKRSDRKVSKAAKKRGGPFTERDVKPAPEGWEPCEDKPNEHTGHWPGWLPVGDGPEDQYHREAHRILFPDGTYELVGPKIQGNPYGLSDHWLWGHGSQAIPDVPTSFYGLKGFFMANEIEGIVWHHPDGRMVKIKRKDFGFEWPVKKQETAQ